MGLSARAGQDRLAAEAKVNPGIAGSSKEGTKSGRVTRCHNLPGRNESGMDSPRNAPRVGCEILFVDPLVSDLATIFSSLRPGVEAICSIRPGRLPGRWRLRSQAAGVSRPYMSLPMAHPAV